MGKVIADTATSQPLHTLTVETEGDDEKFRRFVHPDGRRAGVDDNTLGVCRVKSSADGDLVPVDVAGVVPVEAGAALSAYDWVQPDAEGRATSWTPPAINHEVVDGAAANTNIAVTGIVRGNTLDAVVALDGTAVNAPTIHANGQIRSTSNTTGKKLLVVWRKPYRVPAGRVLEAAAAAGDTVPVLLGRA